MNKFTRWAFIISIPLVLWNLGMAWMISIAFGFGAHGDMTEKIILIAASLSIIVGFICTILLAPSAVGKNQSRNNSLAFFTLLFLILPTLIAITGDLVGQKQQVNYKIERTQWENEHCIKDTTSNRGFITYTCDNGENFKR